ncbi:sensor histidine kinase [Brevundimonas sp. NPDC092305]|uniref:sensor histidine kinase n=1 Tax=Brevundimonas sp. NPDC092305 TaxID=3363957 RepID=UPI0037F80F27
MAAAVWALTTPVALAPAIGAPEPLPWWDYAGVVLVALAGFLLTPISVVASRLSEKIGNRALRVLLLCAAVLLVGLLNAAFDVALYEKIRVTFDPEAPGIMFMGDNGELIRPPYIYLLMHALVYLIWIHAGVMALVTMNRLNWRMRRLELNKSEALAAAKQARLETIRLQLSPHFLFNSLNAISSLVLTNRNAEAERMVNRLSDFLRASLGASQEERVTLTEELRAVGAYLDIESQRFDGRLKAEIVCADTLREAIVPTFLLQPLAEQAVEHAMSPPVRPVVVRISVVAEKDDMIKLSVETRSEGEEPAGPPRPELSQARSRLKAVYGEAAAVQNTSNRNEYGAAARLPLSRPPGAEGRRGE